MSRFAADDIRSSVDKTIDSVLNKLRNSTNEKATLSMIGADKFAKMKSVTKVTQSLGASLRGALG